jgi:hypothetical protein
MDSSLSTDNNPRNLFKEMSQVRQERLDAPVEDDSLLFSVVSVIGLSIAFASLAIADIATRKITPQS